MITNTPTQSPEEIPTIFPTATKIILSSNLPTIYPSNISATMSPTVFPIEISHEQDALNTFVEAHIIQIAIGVCILTLIVIILFIYKKKKHTNNEKRAPNYMSVDLTSMSQSRKATSNIIMLNTIKKEVDYKNWSTNDVVKWILKLDREYKIYKNALIKNMNRDRVNGSNIHLLTSNDLSVYGIRDMEHRSNILHDIKQLITSDVEGIFA